MSSNKRSPNRQNVAQQTRNNPKKYWNKPLGQFTIIVIGGVAVYIITLLISHIWPPRENINRLEIPRAPYSGTVKIPKPGIYMKDVQMKNNRVGIQIDGALPNMVMDNVDVSHNRDQGMKINTLPAMPPNKPK